MEKKLKVLGVMLMEKEKSLMFMLLAFCSSSRVMVVVVPLIALKQDMARQCKRLKIGMKVWNSKKLPDKVQIILVTPEDTLMDRFNSFLNQLQKQE